jgi:Membrane-fusion protein
MGKILLFATIIATLNSCKQGNNQYVIQEHTINEAVYASGKVFPEQYHFLTPTKPTTILQILVKEGDFVTEGDILVVTGSFDETEKIRLASDQVAIAKRNMGENSAVLQEIQNKINIASQQYQQDKINADRYHELSATKAVSQKEVEDMILTAERSLSELSILREQYNAMKNQLANQLITAELQQVSISNQYSENILQCNISGKVYSILKQSGEIANSGTPVIMVGVDKKFKLELSIDERDISKIRIGQTVYFETNTHPDSLFEATITKINPVMHKETRYFKVEASVSDSAAFYPQSSVEASIIIRENVNVLMIPFNYLHNEDSVLLQSNNDSRVIPVKTGIRINDMIEIKAGIEKGNIILKPYDQ